MRFVLRHEVEVPAEIMYEILHYLSQRNLKRVRLVCTELAILARALLFKRISISPLVADVERFLHIVRDADLSRAVEELVYREMHFGPLANPWLRGFDQDYYEATIRYGCVYESEDESAAAIRQRRIHEILGQIYGEYEDQATAMKSDDDFTALEEGLRVMCNLKRIIAKDSRPVGIATDTGFKPPSLSLLTPYFPASDAGLRLLTFSDPLNSPDRGFFTILRALAATGANVPILVTQRTTGLLKQGIPLDKFSRGAEFHEAYAQGFRQLRMISLCVDDDGEAVAFDSKVEGTALSACIQTATNLEHLELSLTSKNAMTQSCLPLWRFLPHAALHKLHTLVLEGIPTTAKEITSFLVLQAGSLRHVTLWNIRLVADDLWKHVLAVLSHCQAFRLESFVLKSPEDADVRQHQEMREVPVRIPDGAVLYFVNEGGPNPFEKRDWKSEPPIDTDLDTASEASDVSDFSVWKEEPVDDLEDIDHDLDGPEYNSDYDTEPDIDFDRTSEDSDLSDVDLAAIF